jgi:hypothetical protein
MAYLYLVNVFLMDRIIVIILNLTYEVLRDVNLLLILILEIFLMINDDDIKNWQLFFLLIFNR